MILKNFIYLLIFTTFSVILLVIFNVYHNTTTSTISQDVGIKISPINPSFDTKTIEALRTRKRPKIDLSEKLQSQPATPSPTITLPTSVPATPASEIKQSTSSSQTFSQ